MQRESRAGWPWVAAGAALLTIAWVGAAGAMVNRGFDVTDEGFYLLSYRWWDSTPRVGTGVQYLYGPVFELLGWNVPALRGVRILAVLASHAAFGWAFMSWLRTRRPSASPSRGWEVAGTLVVVAAGGISFSWLPLTPGYDEVVMLGSLLLVTLVLWSLTAVVRGDTLPVLAASCLGPICVALVLTKWVTAVVTIPFLLVVGLLALRSAGARGWRPYLLAAGVSTLVTFLLVHLLLTPLPALTSEVMELNSVVAASGHSPVQLLTFYLDDTSVLVRSAVRAATVTLVLAAMVAVLHRVVRTNLVLPLVALAPVAGMVLLTGRSRILPGGGPDLRALFTTVLISLSLVVLLVVLLSWWHDRRRARHAAHAGETESPNAPRAGGDVWVISMLVLLPGVQALGTNSSLAMLGVNQFACWAALLVAACTAMRRSTVAGWLVQSSTALAVVVAATSGIDGLVHHPYRAVGFEQATTSIGGAGPLGPMRVDAQAAARYRELRAAVGELREGAPVMAFDHMPGVVLLLGGRSVGEAWYDSTDFERTAAGMRAACEDGWPYEEPPVVIYSRPPTPIETSALAACGFSISSGYRQIDVEAGDPDLKVYLPTTS